MLTIAKIAVAIRFVQQLACTQTRINPFSIKNDSTVLRRKRMYCKPQTYKACIILVNLCFAHFWLVWEFWQAVDLTNCLYMKMLGTDVSGYDPPLVRWSRHSWGKVITVLLQWFLWTWINQWSVGNSLYQYLYRFWIHQLGFFVHAAIACKVHPALWHHSITGLSRDCGLQSSNDAAGSLGLSMLSKTSVVIKQHHACAGKQCKFLQLLW